MRWEELFADLEGQLEEAERAEFTAEVAERSRYEHGRLRLVDRLAAGVGAVLALRVQGVGRLVGRCADAGPDWLLVEEGPREALVPLAAVLAVAGLDGSSVPPGGEGPVRALGLRLVLRRLVRDRAPLIVALTDGAVLTGTLDRVGADHVELAEHLPDELRRPGAVRQRHVLPLAGLAVLRPAD